MLYKHAKKKSLRQRKSMIHGCDSALISQISGFLNASDKQSAFILTQPLSK